MRTFLATIGGSSKRDDFAVARRGFLGQFGIGLTLGERTIEQLLASEVESIPFVADVDSFDAIRDVAVHAEVLVINASGPHESELLEVINADQGERFAEMARFEISNLARPEPYVDIDRGSRLVRVADETFGPNVVGVEVAHFSPPPRPVIWWPAANLKGTRKRLPTLVLNADNATVAHLLDHPEAELTPHVLRSLRINGMLLARSQVSAADALELAAAIEGLSITTDAAARPGAPVAG